VHLIPQSWPHLHILVSVFPSVGFLFVFGFFVAGLIIDNEGMKRSALALFAVTGLLAIPTYFSGEYSMSAVPQDNAVAQGMLSTHYNIGLIALAALLITGAVAFVELWRARRPGGKLSSQMLQVILVLALIALGLVAAAGEFGWEVNHHELQLPPKVGGYLAPGTTPQEWSHVHMILNHFPTVGFVVALTFYLIAIAMNNDALKRGSLVTFVICAILGVPTYVTGAASMWALTDPPILSVTKPLVNAHRDFALLTLFGLAATGGAAWIELWRFRYLGRFSKLSIYLVLAFALVTLAIMAETGHRGGQINHPEIRLPTDIQPTDETAFWTPAIELLINNTIWFVPWQTVHFFGFSLIFGTVLVIVLRVLGFGKSVPFSSVHRILPLGFFGVIMNVFSGMLMLLADSFRYLNESTFAPKIAFIAIGAIAVLYFSLSERIWTVKAGEDAPAGAKAVAVLVLLAWTGVILGGRLLPYV
jgi:uncharacterized membrane protein